MSSIVIATHNEGKAKEFESLFSQFQIKVKTLKDYPELGEIEETGTTFEENAKIKAETIANALGKIVIADDSGLMVDALDGRPGVYSARYAGEEKSDEKNNEKLLGELEGVEEANRTARFYCALAVATPLEETNLVSGTCEGRITYETAGDNGFGYDPIFFVESLGKTMAELTKEEKNKISHRANAIRNLEEFIKTKVL